MFTNNVETNIKAFSHSLWLLGTFFYYCESNKLAHNNMAPSPKNKYEKPVLSDAQYSGRSNFTDNEGVYLT
jgi:hypothetical protein